MVAYSLAVLALAYHYDLANIDRCVEKERRLPSLRTNYKVTECPTAPVERFVLAAKPTPGEALVLEKTAPPTRIYGYAEKLNWTLFGAYWPVLFAFVYFTWTPFKDAWRDLVETEVLQGDGQAVALTLVERLLEKLEHARRRAWVCAFFVAIALNISEVWAVARLFVSGQPENETEWDFTSYWLIAGDPYAASWTTAASFSLAAYLQQFMAVLLAFAGIFQIGLHTLWFFRASAGIELSDSMLQARLNHRSAGLEFGLERWNYALNNLFWVVSVALLIPMLSKLFQDRQQSRDVGQVFLLLFVPLALTIPLFGTILARQQYLPKTWEEIRKTEDPGKDWERYHAQRLWPLDRNWVSKFGVVLAWVILCSYLGVGLISLF